MKKKETSKLWSVRTDEELLKGFKRTSAENGEKPNVIINKFIEEYCFKNSSNKDFITIDLEENKKKLGFEKSFFSIDDAELIIKGNNFLNENYSDEYKENEINRLLNTGVRYYFKNLGISIYTCFYFTESRTENNSPILDIMNTIFYYNENTKVFDDITNDDYFLI